MTHRGRSEKGKFLVGQPYSATLAARWPGTGQYVIGAPVPARVEKIQLREISLVPNPVNARARVLHRSTPSPASAYAATQRKWHDLMIRGMSVIQQQVRLLQEVAHGHSENSAR